MSFRTRIDFSNNRQVKQHIETSTALSGATVFGVPFFQLPTGPNLSTSGFTEEYVGLTSYFSGNTGTTIYNWADNRMVLGSNTLSAITNLTSAYTQSVGDNGISPIFTANTTTIIDGNTVVLTYSGISYDITPVSVVSLGGGNYSGSVYSIELMIYSAATLDFTGRTMWVDVSGITRTNNIIISTGFTPSSSGATGKINDIGTMTWDDNYFYLKTNNGWGRISLDYGF